VLVDVPVVEVEVVEVDVVEVEVVIELLCPQFVQYKYFIIQPLHFYSAAICLGFC